MPLSRNPTQNYLLIRGKPVAEVFSVGSVMNIRFANWTHKLKRGQTRHAVIDWATEKFYTGSVDIQRIPVQAKPTLLENELEANQHAFKRRMEDINLKHRNYGDDNGLD